MILDTLRALLIAGKDAVQTTCGLPVVSERVSQVHQGSLTFPALAELSLTGGPLQKVHLGCDSLLCGHLAEFAGADDDDPGIESVVDRVLKSLLAELPGRNLTGCVEHLDVGPRTLHTRGVRSFGLCLGTEIGQLYMMAEVPSRLELEIAKGSGFQGRLMAAHLPENWSNQTELRSRNVVDSFLIYVRKTESDIEMDIPLGDGTCYVQNGFLIESVNSDDGPALKIALDLASLGITDLRPGTELRCRVGVGDRSVHLECEYLGRATQPVADNLQLECMLVSVPTRAAVTQRRRAFRIQVPSPIPVEIQNVDGDGADALFLSGGGTRPACGHLVDLSFSGARIVGDMKDLHGTFTEGNRVRCRIFFPGESEPMALLGIIRRSTVSLTESDNWRGDLGIEFMVTPHMDRTALDYLRQYVLSEQRAWLAQRIHVSSTPSKS